MTNFTVSGIVEGWRIEREITAISIQHAIKVFENMYSNTKNVYVLNA
jgi:hypothetical protein|tara:strand:- start:5790 stop:5930 length:141 start_codon:yes stop_codon:yes gene_type:complete